MKQNYSSEKIKRYASGKPRIQTVHVILKENSKGDKAAAEENAGDTNEAALVRHASRTAWATIVIAFASLLTFGAAVLQYLVFSSQLKEMHESGVDTHTLALATANGQRAWIGPLGVAIPMPKVDDIATFKYAYANLGSQPAAFSHHGHTEIISKEKFFGSYGKARGKQAIDFCKGQEGNLDGLAFPSRPPFAGNMTVTAKGDIVEPPVKITANVLSGADVLVHFSCFVYAIGNGLGHSSTCYYFQAGEGDISNLAMCDVGQYAD